MRFFSLFFFLLCSFYVWSEDNLPCGLDKYFITSESYKSFALTNKRIQLDSDNNDLSLLPDFFVSMGQSGNNDRSFKKPEHSFISTGISQTLYEGNRYGKKKDLLNIEKDSNYLKLSRDRIQYLLDLFEVIINYRSRQEQRILYLKQLERQRHELKRIEYFYESGYISKLEVEVAKLRIDETLNRIKTTDNEIQGIAQDIYIQFGVPEKNIDNITYDNLTKCKLQTIDHIRIKQKELSLKRLNASNAVDNTLLYPSVSFSILLSPPDDGTLRTLTTKKSDFSASLNLSVPLSNFFSYKNKQSSLAVELDSLKMEIVKNDKEFFQKKNGITRKIHLLKESIQFLRKSLILREREVEYYLSRLKLGKETIMTYLDKLDEYNQEEINLIKKERELELEQVYLYFIG